MKLSVVVPTRERSKTLFYTLQTLVSQDYDDYEILVCDNFSGDDTKSVVSEFKDPRIRYINPGKRLSMNDNWEFALDHVQGDFVTFIGDDDGFLPCSLSTAMKVLEKTSCLALTWNKAEYCWPDHPHKEFRNRLSFRVGHLDVVKVKSAAKLARVLNFKMGYNRLPCVYNSIISMVVIKKVKNKTNNGRFFNSISPDVYSGLILGYEISEYLYSWYPFSVNGASSYSNGTSFQNSDDINKKGSPYENFLAENEVCYDHRILMGPAIEIIVMGEALQIKQHIPSAAFQIAPWSSYLSALVRCAKVSPCQVEILNSIKHTCEKLSCSLPDFPVKRSEQSSILLKGGDFDRYNVICEKYCSNVAEACTFLKFLLPDPVLDLSNGYLRFFRRLYENTKLHLKDLYMIVF